MAPQASCCARLKLIARDTSEIQTLSSLLQDAIIPIGGCSYDEKNKSFAMLAFRFQWEKVQEEGKEEKLRTHTGVSFSNVTSVTYQGFDAHHHKPHMMNFLMMEEKTPGLLRLVFSGNAEIQLQHTQLLVHFQDMNEPWPASQTPDHQASNF